MNEYILAVDQSTSGTKAILFDRRGRLVKRVTVEHKQYYPKPGWVEHNPEEIYRNTVKAVELVLKGGNLDRLEPLAVALTNQRETAVVWDRRTGKPVYNAVVWQCQRGKRICSDLKKEGYEELIKERTGLILDPYFSASKIKWILDNVPGARKRAEAGDLIFGTIDSWLIWNLTGGKMHVTDYSNACRTMLFNIHNLNWDGDLFNLLNIPVAMAPEVKYSDEVFGYTNIAGILKKQIPIVGVLGDSHAALFGQNCYEKGMAKATYGTGSSIMMNIGDKPIGSKKGLVTSLAWGYNGKVKYVFEGNVHCTGATIKWLIDDLELIQDPTITEELAASLKDNGGVFFVPAFVGLGAPYWANEATATITGITMGTKKAHLVRAALEAISYQIRDVLDLMTTESGIKLSELRVDGGPTGNNFLMQFQADILGIKVVRSPIAEVSALGSAYLAGLAVGLWNSFGEIKQLKETEVSYRAKISADKRERLYQGWRKAVARTIWSDQ